MDFRIADTFTDSLARLNGQEQKAAKTTAFDLQMDPSAPGLQFHRIDKSKDVNFWSLRVNRDLRIIVHKTAASILICYVDHHDKAYAWAVRRRIEAHPRTGTIQIVEVHEFVQETAPTKGALEIVPPSAKELLPRLPFESLSPDGLLNVGVPADWLDTIRHASEDDFLEVADHLPPEAAEALLEFASTGMLPVRPEIVEAPISSQPSLPAEPEPRLDFSVSPDTLRRFRVIENVEELETALAFPWEKWTVFLHPSQREIVESSFSGPARVAGSAGTGKTVVALHRAARLAQSDPSARVLLTTFSQPLANALEHKLQILLGERSEIVPRITVTPFRGVAEELYQLAFGRRPAVANEELVRSVLTKAAGDQGVTEFTVRFLYSEWTNVVDAWQLDSEGAYAEAPRLGRKNRLSAKQRSRLWPIFAAIREAIDKRGICTWAQVFAEVARHYATQDRMPFTHIVVDEAQDLGVPELRMLAAIAEAGPDALFFAGDLAQRIFQQPFSWTTVGVNVRERSHILKVNYRTSHQIREMADRLLPEAVRDVDGLEEDRAGTVSVFNGPVPVISRHPTTEEEIAAVAKFIGDAVADGIAASEISIFVRSRDQLDRARAAVKKAVFKVLELSGEGEAQTDRISVGTMHLAKGLEFKAVIVMACDDDVLPLQSRIEAVADEIELDDVYETERQLLYVACTRARDRLLVSSVKPGSEFLADLNLRRSLPLLLPQARFTGTNYVLSDGAGWRILTPDLLITNRPLYLLS
jgi:hypothetical protein